MQTIYLVRHGKTDWNNLGLMQGRMDLPLNEEGIAAAEALAQEIDLDKIDVVLSSPLIRARTTAEILVQGKKPIVFCDDLVERGFGDFEGTKNSWELLVRQWDYRLNDAAGNIETVRDCLARADRFLEAVRSDYADASVLIVSHAGFMKALHYSIKGYDENTDFLDFNPRNTTLYTYHERTGNAEKEKALQ